MNKIRSEICDFNLKNEKSMKVGQGKNESFCLHIREITIINHIY